MHPAIPQQAIAQGPVVVAYEPGAPGHMARMLPVVEALVGAGCVVHVYTASWMGPQVKAVGAHPHDLYALESRDQLDRATTPLTLRWVTFAGRHAAALAVEAEALGAHLILHDSMASVGAAVAARLDLPRVAIVAGHAQPPHRAVATLQADFPVRCSPDAMEAAAVLRRDFGLPGEHPLDFLNTLSPSLNLYGEPPQFLDGEARAACEPLACFGSILASRRAADTAVFRGNADGVRLFVSFGSACWRFFGDEVRATLASIASAVAGMDQVEAVISCGGDDPARNAVNAPNVTVLPFMDQWSALTRASLFITHHGLNSTHEAIWHRVPMLSVPFFHDQPGLARRCQALGLALPLAEPRHRVPTPAEVRAVLEEAIAEAPAMRTRLAEVRTWEEDVIRQRPAVIARILELAATHGATPAHEA